MEASGLPNLGTLEQLLSCYASKPQVPAERLRMDVSELKERRLKMEHLIPEHKQQKLVKPVRGA